MNPSNVSRWFVYLLVGVAMMVLLWSYTSTSTQKAEISISQLAQQIKANQIEEIVVAGNGRSITITYTDANQPETQASISSVSSLEEVLASYGVTYEDYADNRPTITYQSPSQWGGLLTTAGLLLPAIIMIVFIYIIMRQAQGSNNQAMSFGKSRARMFTGD
ncbi:MAG TPA: ATP-dependent metallopeptidase FtsH/Yme1/Tma family protein, partial [Chloroflexota bacterium]|nr:ATP-dependent metallopeptidase FtsH/Yme1/Tma family protein [Chloroflexota bacterium]